MFSLNNDFYFKIKNAILFYDFTERIAFLFLSSIFYMPIEWSERFMGLNVPTITLGSNASNNEKILGLGVLLYSLRTIEIRKSRASA